MEFFVPGGDENTYLALAELAGVTAAEPGQRLRSITFADERPDEVWTAEVGKPLTGEKTVSGRRTQLSDAATVQAIFLGLNDYIVVTDAKPLTAVSSGWDNPFWVRKKEIQASERFD
jgi:hypothetical protein